MSVLLVGLSHRSAPLPVLERFAVTGTDRPRLLAELLRSPVITEVLLVSTCNRVEVYAVTDDRRGATAHVVDVLARHSGTSGASGAEVAEVAEHGVVRFDDDAVRHLFEVAGGLDSLVVGDEQVLGQVRAAYAASTAGGAAGPLVHALVQQALRVGKQVLTDTGLAGAGASVVQAALMQVAAALPGPATGPAAGSGLAGRRAVVLGAGAVGALAVAHLQRHGAGEVLVVNRTPSRASQLVASAGSTAVRAVAPDELTAALAGADVLLACTTSPGVVVGADQVRAAVAGRAGGRGPLVVCDLGLPRNIDPAAAQLPGVVLLDLQGLRTDQQAGPAAEDVAAAQRIVSAQVDAHAARRRSVRAAPVVASLRREAEAVVQAELARLDHRLPDLDAAAREEVARAVRRVADKLLHAPTLALKQLAGTPERTLLPVA